MAKRTTKAGNQKLAIGYIRVSTDEQTQGPKAQRDALQAWAKSEGVELVAVFEDIGISGAAPIDKRPGLLNALDALAEHGAGLLVVAKRDRLARDVIVGAMAERMAERNGAQVVASNGAGNGDGPEAQLMRRMVDAFSEYERALIRARTKAALQAKKARGERTGSVPFGFKLADDGVHLVADLVEQDIISTVQRLRKNGLTLRAIGAELKKRGSKNRSGRTTWNPSSVKALTLAKVA